MGNLLQSTYAVCGQHLSDSHASFSFQAQDFYPSCRFDPVFVAI
jgi:hypothetical protein